MSTDQAAKPYRATAFADFNPELSAPGATPERLEHLKEHGFLIINDFEDSPWIPILREAGRRVTEACAPANGYSKIDCSKAYVPPHRRTMSRGRFGGLIHPAFKGTQLCRIPRLSRVPQLRCLLV